MTTDLTGDSELSEDEFDWDVFLPDPDETQAAAEAAALEDEDELDLDDSDFDWEAALREDSEPENGAGDGTRAGAAYDRIVDTVRRSVEEPEPAADTEAAPVSIQQSEPFVAAEPEPVEFVTALHAAREPEFDVEVDVDPVVGLALEAELETDDAPEPVDRLPSEVTWATTPAWGSGSSFVGETGPAPEAEADVEADVGAEMEPVSEPWPDQQSLLVPPDPRQEATFEPEPTEEPSLPRFVEAAATAGAVEATEWAPLPSSEPVPTWAMAPDEPWEVGVHAEFAPDPVPIPADKAEERKPRSRVFTATVVLACLFLAAVAAALAVRAMHHPTTNAGPPAQVTPPHHASPPVASSAAAARIQTATDAVDSATTAASVGLTSLAAFPTPTNIETVINPYISSLQLYETFLSGTKVPAPAQSAASSAETQLRQDLTFLDTINGLPPQQLGAFLMQFDSDAIQLQTTLNTLEQSLRASAS